MSAASSAETSCDSSPSSNNPLPFFAAPDVFCVPQVKDQGNDEKIPKSPKCFTVDLPRGPPSPTFYGHDSDHSRSSRRSSCRSSYRSSRRSSQDPRPPHPHNSASSPPRASLRPKSPRSRLHRDGPTPSQLRFVARTTGPSSHLAMAMEEVEEGKPYLLDALACLPEEIVEKAYVAKRADRDSMAQLVAHTAAEIESLERHKEFLSAVKRHQESQLAVDESLLAVIQNTLSPRSMMNLQDDNGYYRAVFAEELVSLTVAETQLDHLRVGAGYEPESISVPASA